VRVAQDGPVACRKSVCYPKLRNIETASRFSRVVAQPPGTMVAILSAPASCYRSAFATARHRSLSSLPGALT